MALGLTASYLVFEGVAGVFVRQPGPLSEAGHMFTDAGALGLGRTRGPER
jgi:Co/Zn/Cd efflux system component